MIISPRTIESLELDVEAFIGYESVRESIPLRGEQVLEIGETELQIVDISVTSNQVMGSIQTEPSITLDEVAIIVDGKKIQMENIYFRRKT
ncbi:hypothetical protein [Fervidibacillus albus]|uniref:Uncharacterized protein n=1 Tax=Fervidibacillus albus TaxID=2980026 RepID=A0A9E8LTI9_9BACI|nr:hypothetical protein [Fervidibacillus albus]WAA09358.1 hypothetical protein OE104_12425 [Fervidibacillus albus]